jgi:hypothetical protein
MNLEKEKYKDGSKQCSRCKNTLPATLLNFRFDDYGKPRCHCRKCERETQKVRDAKKKLLKNSI